MSFSSSHNILRQTLRSSQCRAATDAHASASKRLKRQFSAHRVHQNRRKTSTTTWVSHWTSRQEKLHTTRCHSSATVSAWSQSSSRLDSLPDKSRGFHRSRSRRDLQLAAVASSLFRSSLSAATIGQFLYQRPTSRSTKSIKVGNICMPIEAAQLKWYWRAEMFFFSAHQRAWWRFRILKRSRPAGHAERAIASGEQHFVTKRESLSH